jgi:DNA-binding transcriptional MocR family regulator
MIKKQLAKRTSKLTDTTVRDTLKLAKQPGMISFGGGIPKSKTFPAKEMEAICQKLFKKGAEEILQYNQTQGYPGLIKQLEKNRNFYRQKRDQMLEALNKYAPKELVKWNKPQGRLFLWLKMVEKFNVNKIYKKAVDNGVAFIPGNVFFAKEKEYNTLCLSYARVDAEKMAIGIKK